MDRDELRDELIELISVRFGIDLPYTLDDLVNMDIEQLSMIATQDDREVYN